MTNRYFAQQHISPYRYPGVIDVFSEIHDLGFEPTAGEKPGTMVATRGSVEVRWDGRELTVISTDPKRKWSTTFTGVTRLRALSVVRYIYDTTLPVHS